MPVWVDLSEHQVSLNVYNSPDGKRLILRPLAPKVHIPPEITELGFESRGEFYERHDLRFSLQDIQRLFPQAKSRDFSMAEIFYDISPILEANLEQGISTVLDVAGELGGSLSGWEESDASIAGKWRYSNLTIGSTEIRVAVSQAGVVQINGDPFTKEGRELHITRERILASVKAALPPVLASMPTMDAPADAKHWLERIMELPDDRIRELAKILETPTYQHSHWRSFTEIDIHSLNNEKIRSGIEQLDRIAPDISEPASPPTTARAPWHVTKSIFLGESRFELSGEYGQVIFDDVTYRTSEKTAGKAKTEVHERLVTEALYGRTADPFTPSLPPFDVMLDYPGLIYRVNQRAEKNVSRLLSQLGVGTKLLVGEDAYLKLQNPPYMDLVIERQPYQDGDRLYLTHYYRSNGDSCLDCEMVFSIRKNGTLRLVETATQDPFRGGELRALDVSFANMFSKNLLDQKFGMAKVMWPREERAEEDETAAPQSSVSQSNPEVQFHDGNTSQVEKDPRYFNEHGELYESRLEEYMRKVLLKGEEFSTLVFAVENDGTLAGEKFISGSNKASITKARNAFMEKYGNSYTLGHGSTHDYILAKAIKTTFELPVKAPEWLIEGHAYDVAIMLGEKVETPARYYKGAVFVRIEKSFAGNGKGSEFVATFNHDQSSTTKSIPFDEIESWHEQGLLVIPKPQIEQASADRELMSPAADDYEATVQHAKVNVYGASNSSDITGAHNKITDTAEQSQREEQWRNIRVYIDGFRQFLPAGKPFDREALMEAIQPFTSNDTKSMTLHVPKFLGSGAVRSFSLPDAAILEFTGEEDALRISAAGYTCEIQATEPAPEFDEDRPWIRRNHECNAPMSFVGALSSASAWLKENQAWEAKKASYPDGGHQIEMLSRQYAASLHESMPTHHDGGVREMHRSFAVAIMDKHVDYLMDWIARGRGQNDLSKKFFTKSTGCRLPSTIRDITATLYAWAGFTPEQASAREAEKEAAHEVRLQARRIDNDIEWHGNFLSNSRVNHDGEIKTTKQFMDEIIDKGYTHIGKRQSGAAVRYTLENTEIKRSYNIKGKMVDYARAVLAKREQEKAAHLVQEVREEEPQSALRP